MPKFLQKNKPSPFCFRYFCGLMLEPINHRIIGTFGGELPGPLIIVLGAVHGNEPAGVKALEWVFDALENASSDEPDFVFKGKIVGLVGNLQAFQRRNRFIEQDLNRVWTRAYVDKSLLTPPKNTLGEPLEVAQLYELISAEICAQQSGPIVFLDLHTTSAEGGVFSIPTDESESLALAQFLGATAILGLHASIEGTLLGFAKSGGFGADCQKNTPIEPICVAFEAGQHDAPNSATRAAIAIVRCLRAMGNIAPHYLTDVEDRSPMPFMASLPPVVRFRYAHPIEAGDAFKMRPGYANFQAISAGEHLADDIHGPILSPDNGLILMPLYQAKGSDGFFIVQ